MCTYSTVELFINRETRIELESSLLASLFLLRAGVGTHTVHRVGAGFPFRSAEGRKLLRFYRHLTDGKFYTFTLNPGPTFTLSFLSPRAARASLMAPGMNAQRNTRHPQHRITPNVRALHLLPCPCGLHPHPQPKPLARPAPSFHPFQDPQLSGIMPLQ